MKDIEVLAPAGNYSKFLTGLHFGADAFYLAGKAFGLRAGADNFTNEQLKQAVELAHANNKKIYVTINIFAFNKDFGEIEEFCSMLDQIKVDGVIVSDLGVISMIRRKFPNIDVHVSTQANTTNKYSAMHYVEMGVTRIVLARELPVEDIKEIRDYIPDNIELEAFVHGAMCISYSGRCLLSDYLTGRRANRGECVQACRWQYKITEANSDRSLEITEDHRGTYLLNSKDMNMIENIDALYNAGVTSFKIEGRIKTNYYVASVVNAYRRASNVLLADPDNYKLPIELQNELDKTSHRQYTKGFAMHDTNKQYYETSVPVQSAVFIAEVLEDRDSSGYALVEMRNRFKCGEELEILSPTDTFNKKFIVESILNLEGENVEDAKVVQQKLRVKCPYALEKGDILRSYKK